MIATQIMRKAYRGDPLNLKLCKGFNYTSNRSIANIICENIADSLGDSARSVTVRRLSYSETTTLYREGIGTLYRQGDMTGIELVIDIKGTDEPLIKRLLIPANLPLGLMRSANGLSLTTTLLGDSNISFGRNRSGVMAFLRMAKQKTQLILKGTSRLAEHVPTGTLYHLAGGVINMEVNVKANNHDAPARTRWFNKNALRPVAGVICCYFGIERSLYETLGLTRKDIYVIRASKIDAVVKDGEFRVFSLEHKPPGITDVPEGPSSEITWAIAVRKSKAEQVSKLYNIIGQFLTFFEYINAKSVKELHQKHTLVNGFAFLYKYNKAQVYVAKEWDTKLKDMNSFVNTLWIDSVVRSYGDELNILYGSDVPMATLLVWLMKSDHWFSYLQLEELESIKTLSSLDKLVADHIGQKLNGNLLREKGNPSKIRDVVRRSFGRGTFRTSHPLMVLPKGTFTLLPSMLEASMQTPHLGIGSNGSVSLLSVSPTIHLTRSPCYTCSNTKKWILTPFIQLDEYGKVCVPDSTIPVIKDLEDMTGKSLDSLTTVHPYKNKLTQQ